VPDRVQTICSIYLPLCKPPWPTFPSIRPQVLVLSVHGPAILCCSGVARKCAARPPHPEGGSCDSERSPDGP
jgi:hypothetical protein